MQFELTDALIHDILFAMEDQVGEFMLDTVEGVVVGGGDGEHYIDLPEWHSSDGFRLMEHFAAGLRNPIVREELTSALNMGRGVFRAFKDTLSRHPEIEKLWFAYKDQQMKKEIVEWYNALREEWGLEKIGMEPDETDDLVFEDFRIRPFRKEDAFQAEELHRQCLEEYENKLIGNGPNIPVDGLVAESRDGELAGYISWERIKSAIYIQRLEVKAEFRGLGIGEALLKKFIESLDPIEIDQVLLDLPAEAEGFSRVLYRESFKPYTVKYWLKLNIN